MIKYIFSINTGRSGSHYLANILSEFEGISSNHEPIPVMNHKPMIEFLRGNSTYMDREMNKKVKAINIALANKDCYIETNHSFIKGFGWLIPSFIPHEQIGVIFLKRNKDEIIKSLYRIDCTPLSKDGLTWIMNPLMKNPENPVPFSDKIKYNILLLLMKFFRSKFIRRLVKSKYNPFNLKDLKKPRFVKKFEINYLDWYVEETYAQGKKFIKTFPNIKVYETYVNQLSNVDEIKKMFDFFDLSFMPTPEFYDRIIEKTNKKKSISHNDYLFRVGYKEY